MPYYPDADALSFGAPCPTCGAIVTGIVQSTELLEQYEDGVGEPGNPRRLPMQPARRMVPGVTTTRYKPCDHEAPR